MSGMHRLGRYTEHDVSFYGHHAGAPSFVQPIPSRVSGDAHPHPAGPVERTLAESHGHRCVVYRDGEFYDKAPEPHGRFYLGKAQSDADAVSRWRGWLRSQGVDG